MAAATPKPSAPIAPAFTEWSNQDNSEMTIREIEEQIASLKSIWREKVKPFVESFGETFTYSVGPKMLESIPLIPKVVEGCSSFAPMEFENQEALPMNPEEIEAMHSGIRSSSFKGKLKNECTFIIVLLEEVNPNTARVHSTFTEIVFKSSLESDAFLTSRSVHMGGDFKDSYLGSKVMTEAQMKALGLILDNKQINAPNKPSVQIRLKKF